MCDEHRTVFFLFVAGRGEVMHVLVAQNGHPGTKIWMQFLEVTMGREEANARTRTCPSASVRLSCANANVLALWVVV